MRLKVPDISSLRLPGPGRRTSKKVGASPGTLVAEPDARPTTWRIFAWSEDELEEHGELSVEKIQEISGRRPMTWVDVVGVGSIEQIQELGAAFEIHPLALEDAVNVRHPAKIDVHGASLFAIVRPLRVGEPGSDHLAIFARPGLVVTFRNEDHGHLEPVVERLKGGGMGRIRRRGHDYLSYVIVDTVIDGFLPAIDALGDELERAEEEILDDPESASLEGLHRLRRSTNYLRKAIVPHREVVAGLRRHDTPGIEDETRLYLRDAYDHVLRAIDTIESHRELAASLMDFYLSIIGQRTNDVMKLLTIVATIFIPLSFIVGLYGMNFDTSSPWNMPELSWRYGYPFVWGVMITIVTGFLWFLWRKGWL